MKIIGKTEYSNIANVYLGEFENGKVVEFVESVQPPLSYLEKWVLIVSSLFGCPVKCRFCDSGFQYLGKLDKVQILEQILFLVKSKFSNNKVLSKKFKIQFSRSGEPTLNPAVLEVLQELPNLIEAPGLLPSLSSVAPYGVDEFFEKLLNIKNDIYKNNFQMQFSIHSTDEDERKRIIPVKTWNMKKISDYCKEFTKNSNKKVSLNFALYEGFKIDVNQLQNLFDPKNVIIKLTPLNPTITAKNNGFTSESFSSLKVLNLVENLESNNFHVIISIGEYEENKIGSNCGQYLLNHINSKSSIDSAYRYKILSTI